MGPFVPDILSDQMNLVAALFIGFAFGFVLEQAGFSSSRRLTGVFYGYDFTVLRVFFTAGITAISGIILLDFLGYLDVQLLYINPTWLMPAIIGGSIMGIGFIIGGYCPGTSLCAAAIGKIDAFFFIGGGLLGVFLFGELFPLYDVFYESTSLGPIKIFETLGLSQGMFACALLLAAVGVFIVTSKLEQRVNADSAPSLKFPVLKHRLAGLGAVMLGVLFVFLPARQSFLTNKVLDPFYTLPGEIKVMTPDELAFRIIDGDQTEQIIDIRSADQFAALALPGAVNIQQNEFFGKKIPSLAADRTIMKIAVGRNDKESRVAASLLNVLGYKNVAMLQGGMENFHSTILLPSKQNTGTRWDRDVNTFRLQANKTILKMITDAKAAQPQTIQLKKKIQGGC